MGKVRKHKKVNFIVGVICNDSTILEDAKKCLIRRFGDIDFESHPIDFNFTGYYEKEMNAKGKGLERKFLSFKNLISPEGLCDIKLYTNRLEKRFSRIKDKPSRNINLDPGYVTDAKLVLASTKDYFHRIYAAKGIFLELTLYFKKGSFRSFSWTFPDYQTKEYIDIFNKIRALFMGKVR